MKKDFMRVNQDFMVVTDTLKIAKAFNIDEQFVIDKMVEIENAVDVNGKYYRRFDKATELLTGAKGEVAEEGYLMGCSDFTEESSLNEMELYIVHRNFVDSLFVMRDQAEQAFKEAVEYHRVLEYYRLENALSKIGA